MYERTNLYRAPFWQSRFLRALEAAEWARALRYVDIRSGNTDGFGRRAAERVRKSLEQRRLDWDAFIHAPHGGTR